jgi:iron complex transport system ATP-binding protein
MSPYRPFIESKRGGTEASGASASAFALEVEAVSVGYPGRAPVISDLNFGLQRGKVLAVIGPNGSGKTTLFRALAGELPLAAGRVLVRSPHGGTARTTEARSKPFKGRTKPADFAGAPEFGASRPDCFDIHKLPTRLKARLVARVLQNEQSAWAVPVADYVRAGLFAAEGWFSHDPARAAKKTAWALEAMGIAFLAERPVTELSGGEFRRVVIARALLQDTDSLLLAGGKVAAYGKPSEVLTAGIINRTYGARVFVGRHPAADIPQIVPDPEWMDRVRANRRGTDS